MSVEAGIIIALSLSFSISVFFNFKKRGLHINHPSGPISVNYAEGDMHVTEGTATNDADYRTLLEAEFHIVQRTLYGIFGWLEPEVKLRMINEISAARQRLNDKLPTMSEDDKATRRLRVEAAMRLEQELANRYNESIQSPSNKRNARQIRPRNPT